MHSKMNDIHERLLQLQKEIFGLRATVPFEAQDSHSQLRDVENYIGHSIRYAKNAVMYLDRECPQLMQITDITPEVVSDEVPF